MNGRTAFHFACFCDKTNIVEMMLDNAESFKLDLITKDNNGRTGFQCAKLHRRNIVVKIIKRKMPKIALWFFITYGCYLHAFLQSKFFFKRDTLSKLNMYLLHPILQLFDYFNPFKSLDIHVVLTSRKRKYFSAK